MSNEIKVGISDYHVTRSPDTLVTFGLGSCVGVAIYDPRTKIGGLSHIMLPDSKMFRDIKKIEKFADLAIPQMAEEIKKSSKSNQLIAKIAGGASMFQFSSAAPQSNVGERNILAVKKTLTELGIPIRGDHTGGSMGRTMIVDLYSFSINVRMVNREIIIL